MNPTPSSPTRRRQTYCRICEAACGLQVELDENGRPRRIRPDRTHPVSQGYACAKGTRFSEAANHPQRLLFPQQRQGDGSLQRISWPEAMQQFSRRLNPILEQYGPHAVGVYYGNPMLFNALGLLTLLNFNRVLGTRNVYSSFSQDCNNKFAGAQLLHGGALIHPIHDLENASLALMLGTNPAVSQGSFIHLEGGATAFDRFVKRGGQVIWVDPRRSESAQRWGEHLPIRPGTDLFLLLALLNESRQQFRPDQRVSGLDDLLALAADYPADRTASLTGIPADRIRQLARQIQEAPAATFHMSVGVNMGPFGTLSYIALQALAYLTGNFDSPGGLLFHPLARLMSGLLDRYGIGVDPVPSRIGSLVGVFDELPGAVLADEILSPGPEQIRALIVIAGNPLRSIPDSQRLRQAFSSLDLLVQVDLFANESSSYADLLLPAASWLERWDVATTSAVFQQAALLQYAGPVATAPGEALPEHQILAEMSLAISRPLFHRPWLAKLWRQLPLDRLLTGLLDIVSWPYRLFRRGIRGLPVPRPIAGRYLGLGPRTPGRRVRFWHSRLAAESSRLARYAADLEGSPAATPGLARSAAAIQLNLIGRRRRLGHNSWLHGAVPDGRHQAAAWLAPSDLLRLDLPNGGLIQILSPSGNLQINALPRSDVSPGVLIIPHGLPDANINDLIPSGPSQAEPVSGNHWMTGVSVQVCAVSLVSDPVHS